MIGFVIGQNCENTIELSIDSLKGCDKIYFLDGGSTDTTLELIKDKEVEVLHNTWDNSIEGMPGIQKSFMLKHLLKNHKDEWCIYLDADEMLDDYNKLEKWINKYGDVLKFPILNVKMRHLIGDLVHEDAMHPEHLVPTRLFKIKHGLEYPEGEHVVMNYDKQIPEQGYCCRDVTIWHLAYCGNIWDIKKRYDNQINRRGNASHPESFLNQWRNAHLFGGYPKKQFNPVELPDLLLNKFDIEKDELYFANRNLETKHFLDAISWRDFFKCKTAYEFGCGKGPRVYAMNQIGIDAQGLELSEHAVKNSYDDNVKYGDILKEGCDVGEYDLSLAYDVLEHLKYEDLDAAIDNIIKASKKYILISVPVIGDPNLENDPTHIIKETMGWWIEQFTNKNCRLVPTPEQFLFKEQVMVFEK
mgnify:FL=1|jgi:glycosyltransferase involved in cell wall biosynthesis